MKKFISLVLSLTICFSLCSCGTADNGESTARSNDAAATTNKKGSATFTGLPQLKEKNIKVTDPDNSRGLSNVKIEHAYGIAKDSKPHQISVDSQNFFEIKQYKAVTYDTRTEKKVMYLTFDCGYENGYTSKLLDILKNKNVKAAFFCTLTDIRDNPELIARMINEGHIVGNHSTTHPSFPSISRIQMAQEIGECENYLRKNFGYAPKFFRFPKGEYSENALELVGSLGYTSVFWSLSYADWDVNNQKGGDYAFDKVTSRFHPGAIILLHAVSPDNCEAMGRIIDNARQQGYEFSTLDKIPFK